MGEDPSKEELNYAFKALENSDSVEIVTVAASILSESSKKVLLKLIKKIPSYRLQTRIILIPILSSSEYVETYAFMIKALKTETNEGMLLLLMTALSKTPYPIFPLLLAHLNDESKDFREQIKSIMKKIGFENVREALSIFPELPHESHLREVFGDKNIESILK